MSDLDAIRRDHTPDLATADEIHPDGHCHQDSTAWPCDTAIVLAALDERTRAYAVGLDMAEKDIEAALARERRLREAVETYLRVHAVVQPNDPHSMSELRAALAETP